MASWFAFYVRLAASLHKFATLKIRRLRIQSISHHFFLSSTTLKVLHIKFNDLLTRIRTFSSNALLHGLSLRSFTLLTFIIANGSLSRVPFLGVWFR